MSANQVSLEAIGITFQEMDSYINSLSSGIGDPDRQICICGHPMTRHEIFAGYTSCVVSRAYCRCAFPIAVLEAVKVKPFRFASTGYGRRHALTKGVHAAIKQGIPARWLVDLKCMRCSVTDLELHAAPISSTDKICNSSGYRNVFICMPCIGEVGLIYFH